MLKWGSYKQNIVVWCVLIHFAKFWSSLMSTLNSSQQRGQCHDLQTSTRSSDGSIWTTWTRRDGEMWASKKGRLWQDEGWTAETTALPCHSLTRHIRVLDMGVPSPYSKVGIEISLDDHPPALCLPAGPLSSMPQDLAAVTIAGNAPSTVFSELKHSQGRDW
jgi:hypothetical protein